MPCSGAHYRQGQIRDILGDPGADSGGDGKSKRAEKYGTKKSKQLAVLYFSFVSYFSACLAFLSPPLSAPGSPRMNQGLPPFQETPTERRIVHAIYDVPLERKKNNH